MRKANFAENKVSFVRASYVWTTDVFTANNQAMTTDVFTANNQAVTNAVKWGYGVGLLRKSMSVGSETLPTQS